MFVPKQRSEETWPGTERDFIELDVEARRLHLDVSEQELEGRCEQWQPPKGGLKGGYQQLYLEHVLQANTGADLDFLIGCRGHKVPGESHCGQYNKELSSIGHRRNRRANTSPTMFDIKVDI